MKRLSFVVSSVLGVGAMVAVSAPAWAPVVVSPEKVTDGDYETLTVSVPTEKEVPTTEIRVEVLEGFLPLRGATRARMGAHIRGGRRCCDGRDLLRRGDTPAGVPAVSRAGSSPRGTRPVPVEGVPDLQGRQRRRVDRPPIPRSPPL